MEKGITNLTYVGYEGLCDSIVISVADSFRSNMKKWLRYRLKDETKASLALDNMWVDLTWFLTGEIEEMYPNEEMTGEIFYKKLTEEFEEKLKEINVMIEVPEWVKSMEDMYYAKEY